MKQLRLLLLMAVVSLLSVGCEEAEQVESNGSPSTGSTAVYTAWPFDAAEAARRQQETAERLRVPKELTLDCGNSVEMTFVLIPPGEFMMGSRDSEAEVVRKSNLPYRVDADLRQSEHPQHRVRITRPFYMSVTEVTQAQYRAVTGEPLIDADGAAKPAARVSWKGAVVFCRELSERTGRAVQLPTEAQWEYACRAGTGTPFNTGETISTDQANYKGSYTYGDGPKGIYRGQTIPVGSFAANAWGLYDMHGNVCEWCSDWSDKDSYTEAKVDDPQGPPTGTARVIRGGGSDNAPAHLRSASRNWLPPGHASDSLGFRVIVDLE